MQGKIKEKEIDALKLDSIIAKTKFKNQKIDFLNIDIEGNDYEALQSLNFSVYKPKMICIEIDEENIFNSNIYKYLLNLNYQKIWSSKSNLSHIFIENNIDHHSHFKSFAVVIFLRNNNLKLVS